jgi:hypothetical protein
MIIKKTKNQPLPPAEDPQALSETSVNSEEWAASHHPQEPEPVEDPWDQLAYEAGMLIKRLIIFESKPVPKDLPKGFKRLMHKLMKLEFI